MTTGTLIADGSTGVHNHFGGVIFFAANGTFGSGTLQLQVDLGVGYNDIEDATLAANGQIVASLPSGALIKATLTGSTAPNITYVFK
jgi:hypothetical protein